VLTTRSDRPLHDFLKAGGILFGRHVAYRGTAVPLSHLGPGFWTLDHLRLFLDAGGKIAADGFRYMLAEPSGLRFASQSTDLGRAISVLTEVFVLKDYNWLDVEGRIVIDIGANIGDTALDFVRRGATHVIAYEPFAGIHSAAQSNIALNEVANVTLIQAGVGDANRTFNTQTGGWTMTPSHSASSELVTVLDFADVLRTVAEAHPGLPLVCKVDCEGYEHEIFRKGVADFSQVDQWMIEVHGQLGKIPRTLTDSGFTVATEERKLTWMIRAWRAR
jgi:FkbM family methyltransferase